MDRRWIGQTHDGSEGVGDFVGDGRCEFPDERAVVSVQRRDLMTFPVRKAANPNGYSRGFPSMRNERQFDVIAFPVDGDAARERGVAVLLNFFDGGVKLTCFTTVTATQLGKVCFADRVLDDGSSVFLDEEDPVVDTCHDGFETVLLFGDQTCETLNSQRSTEERGGEYADVV